MKYNIVQTMERPAFKYSILVQPVLFSLLFYFINSSSGNTLSSLSIIIKSGEISLWSSICFSSLCDLQREKDTRTLGMLLGTPTSLAEITLGKVIPNTILGLISFGMSTITMLFTYGNIKSAFLLKNIILSTMLLLISYILTALCIIPLFALFDNINTKLLAGCIEYPIYILTGMAFPITMLPKFMQVIGKMLPITWGIEIVNECLLNRKDIFISGILTRYLIIATSYILLSVILFSKVERDIRINARISI